jgi:LCP family protein required for cell wall assembly
MTDQWPDQSWPGQSRPDQARGGQTWAGQSWQAGQPPPAGQSQAGRAAAGQPRAGQPGSGQARAGQRRAASGQRRPAARRGRKLSRRAKVGYWAASVITALVVVAALAGYGIYLKLNGNLHVVNAFAGLTNRPPAAAPGVLNILVLGSQTRDGQGPGFGYDPDTDLSDNLLLVHINSSHTHAIVLSIPRDTMVYEPACKAREGGGIVPAQQQAIIDGAMNLGGPPCAVATVEDLTGIRMDHFIEFDFNSFRRMVNVLGGVEVCVPKPGYYDPYSHLHLSPGKHLIKGDQALAFVRTRHGVGDGSDLGRIELQQEFISSLLQKIKSQGTLDDPVKLLDIAEAATQALTVDPGLGSVDKLLSLADTLRNLHTNDVQFITMPTIEDPADTNRLLPEQPEDGILFQLLKRDANWTGSLPAPAAKHVQLTVLNGAGVDGLAAQTAASLKKFGFDVTGVGNAPATANTTINYDGTNKAGAAYTLLSALNLNAFSEAPTVQNGVSGQLTLVLGADWPSGDGVNAPPAPASRRKHSKATSTASSSSSSQAAVQTRNGAANICSGLPPANPDPGTPP